ncbi:hypothetical protein DYB25_008139 [Aphanomyces astaci]|uniref:Uncharacterized protein n=1 Tax=Aphanomyces astaci TaxID=112090 RepID=A0A397B496_APHAT|nr:hypothetical protein DYB25_008139 [Aphanomyces astaci]
MLELHPTCNLPLEDKERLRVEGLYTIDPVDRANFFGLGRDDFERVLDPMWLRRFHRCICHFKTEMSPYGGATAFVIVPSAKSHVLINNSPAANRVPVTLADGDEIVLAQKSDGTQLKYVVVKRDRHPTMDATIVIIELDYRSECLVLQRCLFDASKLKVLPRPIHLRVHFATTASFQSWCRGLQVLHFSGHGNDQCVYFEDGSGVAVPVTPHQVAALLPSPMTLQLVFVARFYETLAQGYSVQAAFDRAKNLVAAVPNTRNPTDVAEKFQLLPPNCDHDAAVLFPPLEMDAPLNSTDMTTEWTQLSFTALDRSSSSSGSTDSTPSLYDLFPNKLHHVRAGFGYRNVDMRHLVRAIQTHPVVTVTGPEGIGKTQLALATAWFLDLRHPQRDSVRVCLLGGVLDRVLHDTAASCSPLDQVWARHVAGIASALGTTLLPELWPSVIILDGCDVLHTHCVLREYVQDFVWELLGRQPLLRVVLTVRTPLMWTHGGGCTMPLGPLAMTDAAKLLQKSLNRPFTAADYQALELAIPPASSMSSDAMATWVQTSRVVQATRGIPSQVLALVDRLKFHESTQTTHP